MEDGPTGSWETKGRLALGQLDPAGLILTISVLTHVQGGSIPEALVLGAPGLSPQKLKSLRLRLCFQTGQT